MIEAVVARPCDATASAQQVLLRDALYNALGICSYQLQVYLLY
jgi:hypothetical protein